MGTHNSNLNNFFNHLQKFLKSAPLKLTEAFWNELEEIIKKSLSYKNIKILQKFFSDWNDLILFIYNKGGIDMTEEIIRELVEQETNDHYSEEILEKIKIVEQYWPKEDNAPLVLKYNTSTYPEDSLCRL